MKVKSILATISISLLAMVLVITFSSQAAAQNTDNKEKSAKVMISKKSGGERNESDRGKDAPAGPTGTEKSKFDQKAAATQKDADYWFDKGALCATYGNDRAAVKYFQKVISLDPKRSDAYFEQGISYGQLGDFDKAVSLVNKALELEPRNGLYLYGRGRVYLLAGKQDQALEDFKEAAGLDDEDAQDYLKLIAQQ